MKKVTQHFEWRDKRPLHPWICGHADKFSLQHRQNLRRRSLECRIEGRYCQKCAAEQAHLVSGGFLSWLPFLSEPWGRCAVSAYLERARLIQKRPECRQHFINYAVSMLMRIPKLKDRHSRSSSFFVLENLGCLRSNELTAQNCRGKVSLLARRKSPINRRGRPRGRGRERFPNLGFRG